MQNFLGNLRYALRQFRLSPVFTASAVLTLALGIGGTTAIFTLIHEVMLRSLPVSDPAMLYRVGEGDDCCVEGSPQDRWGLFSYPLYERLKAETPQFEETAAFQAAIPPMSVRREGAESAPRPLRSEYVTGSYFSLLGVRAFAGRLLTPEDDTEGSAPVAVISYHVWEMTYGADPAVVGSTFDIEGHSFTVVGITPPGFYSETLRPDPPDIWLPVHQEVMMDGEGNRLHEEHAAWLRMLGRLRPGASTAGMSAHLTTVLRQWIINDAGYPANWMQDIKSSLPKQVLNVVPAGGGVDLMKEAYAENLQLLLVVCAMVLLIACANVANLLLARAVSRRSQTALRLALGATRRQIILQALTESVLLAVAGGIAGLLVSIVAARLLVTLAFHSARFVPFSVAPSIPVLLFTFAVALVTGIIFGIAPAWFATRTDPAEALRASSRSATGRSTFARKALLILQFSVSVALVAGATMLARTLGNLENQNYGYPVQDRILVSLHNPESGHTPGELASIDRQIEDRLSAIPGVRGSGIALYNPLTNNWGEMIEIAGHPPSSEMSDETGASWDRVSAGYLRDLGVPLMRGRYFTAADNETGARVAIVNQAFVKRFFKNGEDPLGQHFGLDMPENAATYQIVGIIGDAHFAGWGFRRPALPMFYVPLTQTVHYSIVDMQKLEFSSHFIGAIMLVTREAPGSLEPLLRNMLAEIDPNMTITSVRTLQQQIDMSFDQEHAVASLAGLFGIVALLLAAVGLYGVTAYTVAQRTNEIGIRMALGAGRAKVVRLILRGAFARVLLGLAIGLPLAVAAGKLIASQLYGVSSWDPLALAAAAVALALCSLFAAIIPAARAASISPMTALRVE
ncbi:MAG TPA: ABC transporter permease [Candidatus Acidoferrales bacterium]|nr:ABC transporter permease [Candidatus Acidoferrales bacterium]